MPAKEESAEKRKVVSPLDSWGTEEAGRQNPHGSWAHGGKVALIMQPPITPLMASVGFLFIYLLFCLSVSLL